VADTRPAPPQLAAAGQRAKRPCCDGYALLDSENSTLVLKALACHPPLRVVAAAVPKASLRQRTEPVRALADLKQDRGYAGSSASLAPTAIHRDVLDGQLIERFGKTVAVAGQYRPRLLDTLIEKLEVQARDET
jgi:UDP-N-acetylmuramoylalanine--D-glutamate ligase